MKLTFEWNLETTHAIDSMMTHFLLICNFGLDECLLVLMSTKFTFSLDHWKQTNLINELLTYLFCWPHKFPAKFFVTKNSITVMLQFFLVCSWHRFDVKNELCLMTLNFQSQIFYMQNLDFSVFQRIQSNNFMYGFFHFDNWHFTQHLFT